MIYDFHPEAEVEFLEAIKYYESCEAGLGQDFAIEVHLAIQSICEYPTTWPILDGDIRRRLANRFPYGILYSVEQERILVLAVMHLHRDPGYWKHSTL